MTDAELQQELTVPFCNGAFLSEKGKFTANYDCDRMMVPGIEVKRWGDKASFAKLTGKPIVDRVRELFDIPLPASKIPPPRKRKDERCLNPLARAAS